MLFRYHDEHSEPFWATAGGELRPGETYPEAARRELLEETGRSFPLGPVVREREAVYPVARSLPARWVERYFLIEADEAFAPSRTGWTEEESATIRAWQWWSMDEMAQSPDDFRPDWLRTVVAESVL